MSLALNHDLVRWTSRLALSVATTTFVAIPMIYFLTAWHYESTRLKIDAEHTSQHIAEMIHADPETWHAQDHLLADLLAHQGHEGHFASRNSRLIGLDGTLLMSTGPTIPWPRSVGEAALTVGAKPLAKLQIAESLRPAMINSGKAGFLGLLLSVAIYLTLKTLPLRALKTAERARVRLHDLLEKRNAQLGLQLTELRQTQDGLRESEQRLRVFLQHAPAAACLRDENGRLQLINERFERWYGQGVETAIGRTLEEVLPVNLADALSANDEAVKASGRTVEREQRVTLPNGEKRVILAITFPILDSQGQFAGLGSSNMDITERKLAEDHLADSKLELECRIVEMEELQSQIAKQATEAMEISEQLGEARAQLYDAVESISEGFALWDTDDKLIMCNQRYRRIYPELDDVLEPGLSFEEFTRVSYERGLAEIPHGGIETEVRERVERHRTSINAFEHQLANGTWLRISKRKTRTGHIVGIVSDISKDKETEATIRRMALEDDLTGLPNRAQFQESLSESIAHCQRTGRLTCLMLLDLDRFKSVNDTLGHPAGDELLRQVSQRLLACARQTDTVARLGGDEFGIIVTNCNDPLSVTRLAERIVERLAEPFMVEGNEVNTGTSIGISIYPQDCDTADHLLRGADLALYRAKEHGRGTWQIYDDKMNAEVRAQRQLERDLRRALRNAEFHIVYQPRIEIPARKIVGAEALLRWNHPEHGAISPATFIPVAESAGIIVPITQWLFRQVCAQNKRWQDAGLPPVCTSVNLSPVHLYDCALVDQVEDVLTETGLAPEWLELEITEGAAMTGGDSSLECVLKLKELGVTLSIDDFGTGYSSLDRLKKLPVDTLKIDKSFVGDIMLDANDAAICSAAIQLAHSLGIGVIAEGVETLDQYEFLVQQGCEHAQGYLFSRPLPPDDFAALLATGFPEMAASLETAEPAAEPGTGTGGDDQAPERASPKLAS